MSTTPITISLEYLHDKCAEPNEHGCRIWKLSTNSGGYPLQFFPSSSYCVTAPRLIAGMRIGMTTEADFKEQKDFRGWQTCGNRLCCTEEHIRGGSVQQHRAWLKQQGRTKRKPEHTAKLTLARRARPDIKVGMAGARVIRAERAAGITRDAVAARHGINKDMVTRITLGQAYRESVAGSSIFSGALA
jgi:hypothetical protein